MEDVYLPLLPSAKIDKLSGSGLFFWRQWNSCLKLISNLTCFSAILSKETIQELILDKIINGQLLLKLNNLPKVRLFQTIVRFFYPAKTISKDTKIAHKRKEVLNLYSRICPHWIGFLK